MTWARFDDSSADHRKIINAGNEAAGAWWRMVVFSNRELTDGKLTQVEAMRYAGRKAVIAKLLAVGLLEEVQGGGYLLHDFHDYNPTAAQVRATRQHRADAGAVGGRRSGASRRSKPEANASAPAVASATATPAAPAAAKVNPVPVPGPGPEQGPSSSARAGARVVYDEDAWGMGAWEALWRDTLRRAPGDRYKDGRDRWRDLVARIGADAGLMAPPMAPAALAEALMRALPAYADHAGRSGERVPSVSVAAFEGWYATLLAWVERTRPRPQARGTTPAPAAPAAAPPPTAEELAATMAAMQRLGFSGRQLGDDAT